MADSIASVSVLSILLASLASSVPAQASWHCQIWANRTQLITLDIRGGGNTPRVAVYSDGSAVRHLPMAVTKAEHFPGELTFKATEASETIQSLELLINESEETEDSHPVTGAPISGLTGRLFISKKTTPDSRGFSESLERLACWKK